jgi:hypothetical protein
VLDLKLADVLLGSQTSVPAELGRLALERLAIVAEFLDQLARLVGADAGAFGKVLDFIALPRRYAAAVGLANLAFVVGHFAVSFVV